MHALCDDVQAVPVHVLVLSLLAVRADPARVDHVLPVRIRLRYSRLLHSEQKWRDACARGPYCSRAARRRVDANLKRAVEPSSETYSIQPRVMRSYHYVEPTRGYQEKVRAECEAAARRLRLG
jgi:hypothetical protein